MKRQYRPICRAVMALWCGATLACGAETLRSDTAELTIGAGQFELRGRSDFLPGVCQGEFYVYDGKTKKSWRGPQAMDNPLFQWQVKPRSSRKVFELSNTITNRSDRELWLEPGLALTVPAAPDLHWWGGLDVAPVENAPLRREGFKGRSVRQLGGSGLMPFPVSALFTDRWMVFLGQHQFDWVSWNGAWYEPGDGRKAQLRFGQRIVVAPGHTVEFTFLIGAAPVRTGREENVVQACYDAFPERWKSPLSQDNPYLWYSHAQYRTWYYQPDYEKERRYYSTVDWAYAPFKRSGDFFGRPEFWNYKPVFDFSKADHMYRIHDQHVDYKNISCEAFHRYRKGVFQRYGRDFGLAFYICPNWCEINLAKEVFPDSINQDTVGDVPMILGPWVTWHDREIRMFPYGTKYGKMVEEDLKKLYAELDLPGISIDCGGSGVNYRGPATANPDLKGRAWDENGRFFDEMVTADYIIDLIRALNPADPPFVFKNGQGKGDIMMIESEVCSPRFASRMPLVRYNIGMRQAVVHSKGLLVNENIPDWRYLGKDDFYREMKKLCDHVMFTDFQYGATESHVTEGGNAQLMYAMPELLEAIRNGWQALCPVKVDNGDKMLYRSRFGSAADTIFFFGNPWEEPMKLNFQVLNDQLGEGVNLFVVKMRDRAALNNTVKNRDTFFQYTLPSRLPVLFEAVCNLNPAPSCDFNAAVTAVKDVDRIVFTVKLDQPEPFSAVVTPRWIHRYRPQVRVNGTVVTGKTDLPPRAEIIIEYTSDFFRCTAADILSFPFTDARNVPIVVAQVPAAPNPAENRIAARLQYYFRFTGEQHITAPGKVRLVKADAVLDEPAVRIAVNRGLPPGISRAGNTITVAAGDERTAMAMMKELLYVLDRRFDYIIPFGRYDSLTPEIHARFDLKNHPLPRVRCFETPKGNRP